jgi:hypothetical protein
MLKHPYLEYPLCVLAVISPLVVVVLRLLVRKEERKPDGMIITRPLGIGVRLIQLTAVLTLVPTIAVLGLEGVLNGEGVGALLGAIVGYALAGISEPVPDND